MKKRNLPKKKYIVGIDEVGRGPLAGPVAVCAFKMPIGFNARKFGIIKDSKKLTPEKREEIFAKLEDLKKQKNIDYSVCCESAKRIDAIGLSKAIKNCLEKSLKNIKARPNECRVLLDGGLRAPTVFQDQKTIIKGDEKERAIAFASIVAKVSRDALMRAWAKKYPQYGFDIHKGYGTRAHLIAVQKNGLSVLHRRSFCKNINLDKKH